MGKKISIIGLCCIWWVLGNSPVLAQEKTDTVSHPGSWTDLNPVDFEKLLSDTLVMLLDVRTAAEYQAGHIGRAKNLDVRQPVFDEQILLLDRKRPVAVYCRSGVRSRMAARKLVKQGFKVYNLDKGYASWPKR